MMGVNAPKRFDGGHDEAAANVRSHWFIDGRCADCDCRPWGRVAEYPCGAHVPRVENDRTALAEFEAGWVGHAMTEGFAIAKKGAG